MNIDSILTGYNLSRIHIGALGGHSGLDVAHGAGQFGFKSVVVAQEGREKTFEKYYKTRGIGKWGNGEVGK